MPATLLLGVVAAVFVGQVRRPQLTPELRGFALAQKLGCFACHGPDGTGGTPNPGSDEEAVPAWDGGNVMMYVESEQEIREWILEGQPRRLAKTEASSHGDGNDRGHSGGALVHMPAYAGVVSASELEDLVAYYKVVAGFEPVGSAVRSGYRVASRSGCFGCHGPRGLVGRKNPRSFKGYIPPWRGADYRELVKNDAELRQWIMKGRVARLETNPIARLFTGRQIIQMPAYEDRLTADELDDLVAYIGWLQERER